MNLTTYIIRRLGLIIPTLFGILVLNFAVIQLAPGGPVEQAIANLQGYNTGFGASVAGSSGNDSGSNYSPADQGGDNAYRGSMGLPQEVIERIEKQYGFDKPWWERFATMVINYVQFDFGDSYFSGRPVVDMIIERLPVSISLGLWSTLLTYLISIPLGIRKAVKHGSTFDVATSMAVVVGYAIPGFIFAILLIVLFAGGQYFNWFPLRGLVSDNFHQLSTGEQILDYAHHIALPTLAMVIGNFATLTMLTKNSFLDQINQQYVMTARAKGLTENKVLYGHVFRNSMLIVIAGFPAALNSVLFTGVLFIEIIFSLDGLGLLGYEAIITRDYPVIFSTLYFFSLLGLILGIISDVMYSIIDPRIDFETRDH